MELHKREGDGKDIHCSAQNAATFVYLIYKISLIITFNKFFPMFRIKNCFKGEVNSFILDCEAVAWDPENKAIKPFQVYFIDYIVEIQC